MTTSTQPAAATRRGGGRSRPTLSLCVATRGPADRVHALLRILRPHVDEIVLAVNQEGGIETLEACADLVDTPLVYELTGSPSGVIAWLVSQCSCDWVLRLDDDEMPSAEFLERLRDLIADPLPTVYALRRWWLHPTSGELILTPPWGKDWAYRLIRNMPSLWWFAGLHHTEGTWTGDVRYLDDALYHLDGLVKSREDRLGKSRWYDGHGDALISFGVPVNHMYTPEDHDVETAPVPEADASLIAALVEPAPAPPGRPVPGAAVTATAEIRHAGYARPVSPRMYGARLELVNSPRSVPAGGVAMFEAHVTNLGDEVWPRFAERHPHVKLGFRWAPEGEEGQDAGGRIEFTCAVMPGAEVIAPMPLRAPVAPGTYTFEVDILHEGIRWFGVAQRATVEITPAEVDRDAEWVHNLHEMRVQVEHSAAEAHQARAEAAATRADVTQAREAWESAHLAHENARAETAAVRAELEELRARLKPS